MQEPSRLKRLGGCFIMAMQVGFVFQFYNLIPSLTARENVALVTEVATEPMPLGKRRCISWVWGSA